MLIRVYVTSVSFLPRVEAGGTLVAVSQPPDADRAAEHGVNALRVMSSPPVGKVLTEAAAMIEAGHIMPVVSTVMPLSEMRKAHEMIEGKHTRGKLVIQVVA